MTRPPTPGRRRSASRPTTRLGASWSRRRASTCACASAEAGERAAAFLLDAAIIVGVLIALTAAWSVVAVVGAGGREGQRPRSPCVIWLLGFFLLRNVYFIAFELDAAGGDAGQAGAGPAGRRARRRPADRRRGLRPQRHARDRGLPAAHLPGQPAASGRSTPGSMLLGIVWSGGLRALPAVQPRPAAGRRPRRRHLGGEGAARAMLTSPTCSPARPPRAGRLRLHRRRSSTPTGSRSCRCWRTCCAATTARPSPRSPSASAARSAGRRAPDESDCAFLDAYYAAPARPAGDAPAVRPPPPRQVRHRLVERPPPERFGPDAFLDARAARSRSTPPPRHRRMPGEALSSDQRRRPPVTGSPARLAASHEGRSRRRSRRRRPRPRPADDAGGDADRSPAGRRSASGGRASARRCG